MSHMLLLCEISIDLWGEVENWIQELGMENYNMSPDRIILGDMENATSINTIIFFTKKIIYNAMKKEQEPNIINVKIDVKNFYFQEKYRHYIKGKGRLFDKKYLLLSNIYEKK